MNILISILGGAIVGLIIGYFLWRGGKKDADNLANSDQVNLPDRFSEKAKHLEMLKESIDQTSEKITNEWVQSVLNVSDATAVRYLDELERAGLIKQMGETGQSVYYIKN